MKTDMTRITFDPAKRYSSVRLKQGAVQMDADWNEEIEILAHREALGLTDIIGPAGVPEGADGFRLVAAAAGLSAVEAARPGNQPVPPLAAGDLMITAGRAYVQGLLVENPAITTLATQPDLPGIGPLTAPGLYLAYLDVWERPITSLEDPSIREVALGGPDTATRTRRIWQVRTVQVGNSGVAATCGDNFPAFDAAVAAPTGRLAARAEPDPAANGPCVLPEDAGYRSLENQLYRVECRVPGDRTQARFVWSRENGSVVTAWQGQVGPDLTVSSTGPDRTHGFANGDWVELIDAGRELRGEAGTLVRVLTVRGTVLTIDPATATGPTALAQFPVQPRIRRWDGNNEFGANGDQWVPLEQGVQVRFAAGTYRVGDHWMIPARTNIADVDWPRDGAAQPLLRPPAGITHAYARLALVDVTAVGVPSVTDCRALFPPLTGLVQLQYVGGDGQEAMPDLTAPLAGVPLPAPLQVSVSRGGTPVVGARVLFQVTSGGGLVDGTASFERATDAAGVAAVTWRLGAVGQPQRVEARLLSAAGTPRHVPVRFAASFSMAAQVAFDPANCPPLTGILNVQDAIEALCKMTGPEPGFRLEKMAWVDGGAPYEHDGFVTFDQLQKGLLLICDDIIDPLTVLRRPVVYITVFGRSWDDRVDPSIARVPIRLEAELQVTDNLITWVPNQNLLDPFDVMIRGVERPLLELTVRGNNIRAVRPHDDGSPRWLDAEGLESDPNVILPTGDTRRGGTLVSWFWLGAGARRTTRIVDVGRPLPFLVSGRVVDSQSGAGRPDVLVTLTGRRIDPRETRTDAGGGFEFREVPATILSLAAEVDGDRAEATVPPLILLAEPFRPNAFDTRDVTSIAGVSTAMAARLTTAGIDTPDLLANLDAAELVRRLGVSETSATTLLRVVRAAARPRG